MIAPAIGRHTLREHVKAWVAELDSRSDFWFLALALLPMMVLVLLPVSWHPNDEHNYIIAHRSVNPEAYSPFQSAFDRSNARFLYNFICGNLIEAFGFETVQIALRLVMAGLYAVVFAFLFSTISVSALRALAVVVLFDFAGETIHGDDWLFSSAESKTFAYAAVIFAIGLGLKGRWRTAMVLAALATYMHFLVGGFWALAVLLLALLRDVPWRRVLPLAVLYALVVAPLIVVVALEQLGSPAEVVPGGPDPNVIYALRNPHHIAPFAVESVTWTWVRGVAGALFLVAMMIYAARRVPDRSLPNFALALLLYFFLASLIAYLDRHTHVFAKFYLFRPASLTLFLTLAIAMASIDLWLPKSIKPRLIPALAAIVLLGFVVQSALKVREYVVTRDFGDMAALIEVVQRESEPDEIVLMERNLEKRQPYVSLPRRFQRPTLVSWKSVPGNPADLMRWHELLQYRDAFFESGCSEPLVYPIRLLVLFNAETIQNMSTCGPVVWRGEEIAVIRVDEDRITADGAKPAEASSQ